MSQPTSQRVEHDDFREFALVLRTALLMIVRWIEKKYRVVDRPQVTHVDTLSPVDRN